MKFLRPQHPKGMLAPRLDAVERMIAAGLYGQRKVHGHRAQIHIEPDGNVVAFTRQGHLHTSALPEKVVAFLATCADSAPIVLDGEWQKHEGRIYLFDVLATQGRVLDREGHADRFARIAVFESPWTPALPCLRTAADCWAILTDSDPMTEGLVFRNPATPGFADTAIVRCRKSGGVFAPLKLQK